MVPVSHTAPPHLYRVTVPGLISAEAQLIFSRMTHLLEAAVQKQELINGLIGWFDDGPHDVKSAVASLFAATQHAGVFYADGL